MLSILFFKRTERYGSLDEVQFDAILSEVHDATSRVTEFPVEGAVNISDHIINEPKKLRIQGFITNDGVRPFGGIFGEKATNAFNKLFELRDEKVLVKVVSGLKVYHDMAITSIHVPKDRGGTDSLTFTVDLTEIKKTTFFSLLTPLSILPLGSIADQAATRLNLGRQTVSQVSSAVQSVVSGLSRGFF